MVLKRARYFIVCQGFSGARGSREETARALLDPAAFGLGCQQLSMFEAPAVQALRGQGMPALEAAKTVQEEAVSCLVKAM